MDIVSSKKINEGAYGCVFKCQLSSGEYVAIKENFSEPNVSFCISIRELDMLFKLSDHPNVLKLKQYLYDCSIKRRRKYKSDTLYFVFDKADVDLFEMIDNELINPNNYERYRLQLLRGLCYIHKNGIIHRDLKPENILYFNSTDEMKICDFGLSKSITTNERNTLSVLVPAYRAPEMFFGDDKYDYKVDVFSLGIILYEILHGKLFLPSGANTKNILSLILQRLPERVNKKEIKKLYTKCPNFKVPSTYIDMFKEGRPEYDLIKRMIRVQPKDRVTTYEALQLLNDDTNMQCGDKKVIININNDIKERSDIKEVCQVIIQKLTKSEYFSYKSLFSALDLFDVVMSSGVSLAYDILIIFLSCYYLSIKYFCTPDIIPVFKTMMIDVGLYNDEVTYDALKDSVQECERKIIDICSEKKGIFRTSLYHLSIEFNDHLNDEMVSKLLDYYFSISESGKTARYHYKLFRGNLGFLSSPNYS